MITAVAARSGAIAAAQKAGVHIAAATTVDELDELRDLVQAIWGPEVVPPRNLLRGMAIGGACMLVARSEGRPVAFALSFLGVWELPIPGFIGEKAGHVQSQEGPMGAFLKGVLSTVLATPCSGPFLGPVFGYTLTQPTAVTYAVFGSIALGMSLPYILVGLFPALVRFLPRPGPWMATFKEVLGFVMLGTVAYLFYLLRQQPDWFVPTFVMPSLLTAPLSVASTSVVGAPGGVLSTVMLTLPASPKFPTRSL